MRYSCSLILAFYSIVRDMATAVPGWVFLCDECKTPLLCVCSKLDILLHTID